MPYTSHACCHFQSFLSQQSCKLNEEKKRLIRTRHCKYTQVWCLGQLCDNKARVFPSNRGGIGTCVNELTGYHDCYRYITWLNKYYGHQRYRIHLLRYSTSSSVSIFDLYYKSPPCFMLWAPPMLKEYSASSFEPQQCLLTLEAKLIP